MIELMRPQTSIGAGSPVGDLGAAVDLEIEAFVGQPPPDDVFLEPVQLLDLQPISFRPADTASIFRMASPDEGGLGGGTGSGGGKPKRDSELHSIDEARRLLGWREIDGGSVDMLLKFAGTNEEFETEIVEGLLNSVKMGGAGASMRLSQRWMIESPKFFLKLIGPMLEGAIRDAQVASPLIRALPENFKRDDRPPKGRARYAILPKGTSKAIAFTLNNMIEYRPQDVDRLFDGISGLKGGDSTLACWLNDLLGDEVGHARFVMPRLIVLAGKGRPAAAQRLERIAFDRPALFIENDLALLFHATEVLGRRVDKLPDFTVDPKSVEGAALQLDSDLLSTSHIIVVLAQLAMFCPDWAPQIVPKIAAVANKRIINEIKRWSAQVKRPYQPVFSPNSFVVAEVARWLRVISRHPEPGFREYVIDAIVGVAYPHTGGVGTTTMLLGYAPEFEKEVTARLARQGLLVGSGTTKEEMS